MSRTRSIVVSALLLSPSLMRAEDVVTFRDRSAHGENVLQTIRGRIESETLAGIKIAGKTISPGDVVSVEYELPGGIRLDAREARQLEDAKRFEDAARKYRLIANSPQGNTGRSFKPHFDFRLAWATAQSGDKLAALEALRQYAVAHPDRWERVAAAKSIARLALTVSPPDFAAARAAFQDLAKAATADEQLRNDCAIAVVDLWLAEGNRDEARKALAAASVGDPRAAVYRIAIENYEKQIGTKLGPMLNTASSAAKPAVYSLLADDFARDPKGIQDALFAYLKIELMYSGDWYQTQKARIQLSQLFSKIGSAERARTFQGKASEP